ncbi:hypothetical protein [Flavobacterium mekongense]|uniref:hypothetical protein n=1 Tax=Flavobacterium mekongense TaxID=3379707 RepID=UPI00399A3411
MKLKYLGILFFVVHNCFCQKLPDDFKKQPDGITIQYFDYTNQNNLIKNYAFIGKKMKFKFPERNNFNRINITDKKAEIELIEAYLNYNFLENLKKCSREKKCPDTLKGYFLMIKKGKEIKFITIGLDCMTEETCGNEELKNIINAYQNL